MPRDPVKYTQLPKLPINARPEWATFIKYRGFKTHKTFGQAKSAITNAGHGLLYRWMRRFEHSRDEQWTTVAVVNEGDRATHPLWTIKGYKPDKAIVLFVIEEEPV